MSIKKETGKAKYVRLSVQADGVEVGHAYVYVLRNDLHTRPFGLMEDVFVDEAHRGSGIGTQLVQAIISEAKEQGCYKIIGTSRIARNRVHELYTRLGFFDYGKEFRMDLE